MNREKRVIKGRGPLYTKKTPAYLLVLLSLFISLVSYANQDTEYRKVELTLDSLMMQRAPGSYVRQVARQYYNDAVKEGHSEIEVLSALAIATSYYTDRNNFDSLTHYLHLSFSKIEEVSNVKLLNRVRFFSATIDYDLGNTDAAMKRLYECIANAPGEKYELMLIYNALGANYEKAGMLDSAYAQYQKSADYARELDPAGATWIYSIYNLANLQLDNKEFRRARSNISLLYKYSEQNNFNEGLFYASLLNSEYYLSFKRMDSAKHWVDKAKLFVDINSDHMSAIRYYESLIAYYTSVNNVDSVVYYMQAQMNLDDSVSMGAYELNLVNTQRFYTELLKDLEQDKHQQSIELEQQKSRFYLVIIILGSLLFIFIVYFGYSRYKRRIMSLGREKEGVMLKLLSANQNIEHKEKSIASFALDMVRRNEFMEYMTEELDQLSNLDKHERNQKLREMKLNIKAISEINSDSKEILQQTSDVSAEFYAKLESILPSISNKEKRLCVLVRLGLRQKEIAIILNTPLNSVNSNTYRLKKKFGLDKETSFKEYLMKL